MSTTPLVRSVRNTLALIIGGFSIFGPATALKGGILTIGPHTYKADHNSSRIVVHSLQNVLSSASYEYTGFGAAESSIDIADDGTLIYTPAFTNNHTGYATSKDDGKTWNMGVPSPNQPRMQPMFNIHDGRYFYWSSGAPGLHMSYSDDRGETWKKIGDHVIPFVQDWAKIVSGNPVRSQLKNASSILYISAPSLISVPISGSLGPKYQLIAKSVDRGITWKITKSAPTLNATRSGGACAALPPTVQSQEYIIWSNGLVRPNGTVMYGLRRCRSVSVAISDDEGDTWRFSDISGSTVVPYTKGIATWPENGNVLTPEPISQDLRGNLYTIWVDADYILRMSTSKDGAASWTKPVVISSPTNGTRPLMAYHPIIRHHPKTPGRAALAYYGSTDGGATWNAYLAETADITADFPIFQGFVANEASQPMQQNLDRRWDQGYQNPFQDLVEFAGLSYHPKTDDVFAAFARKMCSKTWFAGQKFDSSSCFGGWDFNKMSSSLWQGYVVHGRH